jgi:cytochrome c
MKHIVYASALSLLAAPAFAESHAAGDAAAGEEAFNRQCVACHVIVDDAGETIAGRNARTGPNLYGVVGRQAGTVEDFRYGDDIVKAGEDGLVWGAESLVAYLQDPTGYLREVLDDRRARGKMAYRVRAEEDAVDLYAYLATFSDMDSMMEEGEATEGEGEQTN